jgi:hypothetical protein
MPFQMLLPLKILTTVGTENHIDDNSWDEFGMSTSSELRLFFNMQKKFHQADPGGSTKH